MINGAERRLAEAARELDDEILDLEDELGSSSTSPGPFARPEVGHRVEQGSV